MDEIWKDVVGYEGIYQVSNSGAVRRIAYFNKGYRWPLPKYLKPRPNHKGYVTVALNGNGKVRAYSIHRLVMAAFVGPCPDGLQVNHKNGIKTDNRVENLEYVTGMENMHHAIAMGWKPLPRQEHQQKITDDEVREVRRLYLEGATQVDIGKRFGVSQTVIWKIVHAHSRQWVR